VGKIWNNERDNETYNESGKKSDEQRHHIDFAETESEGPMAQVILLWTYGVELTLITCETLTEEGIFWKQEYLNLKKIISQLLFR
jgi:hypothetical protein